MTRRERRLVHAGRWKSASEVDNGGRGRGGYTCRILSSDVLFYSEGQHKNSSSCQFRDFWVLDCDRKPQRPLAEMKHTHTSARSSSRGEVSRCGDWIDTAVQLVCVCVRLSEGVFAARLPPLLAASSLLSWEEEATRSSLHIFLSLSKSQKTKLYLF